MIRRGGAPHKFLNLGSQLPCYATGTVAEFRLILCRSLNLLYLATHSYGAAKFNVNINCNASTENLKLYCIVKQHNSKTSSTISPLLTAEDTTLILSQGKSSLMSV